MTFRIVVVGTGTDVGKTHVTCALLAYLAAAGIRPAAYKPIATGVEGTCEDARLHAEAMRAGVAVQPAYVFRRPVSPHLAAREEGRVIDVGAIRRRVEELEVGVDVVVVETAGGLFTPLDDARTNVDLLLALMPARVLLVAPDRLGVLHDVGACTTGGAACGVGIDAIVLSAPAIGDASTGGNAAELGRIGHPVASLFPRTEWTAPDSARSAARAWEALRRGPG